MDVTITKAFVTEDDIAASLRRKERINDIEEVVDCDSVSLGGSRSFVSVGTLSGLSMCSEFSLSALKQKKNQLIESIRSQLSASRTENECTTPNTSFSFDNLPFTSTPCPFPEDAVPPAAKLLKDWRCFSNIEEIANKDDSSDQPIRYEEAFESLKEILGESEDMLGTYESALDNYKKNEDKKLEEIVSFLEEGVEDSSDNDNDTTVIDLVTTLKDDKSKDDNDNTIICIDSSTSVAETTVIEKLTATTGGDETIKKELDSRDPENLIIAPGEDVNVNEVMVNEEDEERLLASDEEPAQAPAPAPAPAPAVVPEAEVKPRVWTEFISNDPDENRDNNDPQWEYLRNLDSHYERYLAVRQRWRNIDIPNPKKDLTCRCRQVPTSVNQRSCSPMPVTQSRKRPHSPDANSNGVKKPKVESCTLLFDRAIRSVLADLEYQKQLLDQEQKSSLNQMADAQRLEQIQVQFRRISNREMSMMKNRHCKQALDLVRSYSFRREQLMALSKKNIEALRQAAAEVREFHEFYPVKDGVAIKADKNALTYLTADEVEELLDIESMFARFEQFYS